MAETKGGKGKSTAAAEAGAHLTFVQAYQGYARRLHEVWEDACTEEQRVHSRHASELNEICRSTHEEVTEAQRGYAEKAAQKAGSGEEARKNLADLAQKYQDGVRKAVESGNEKWQKVQKSYQEALTAAAKGYGERCEAAYREYLGWLKEAWPKVDPATLDAAALGVIATSIAAAAQAASTTSGRR